MSNPQVSDIMALLDASPTAQHLVSNIASRLLSAKFVDLSHGSFVGAETAFIASGGSLIAWRLGRKTKVNGFRIAGAHTDSPGLRIKPNPEDRKYGVNTLQVEVYGSPLLNSWLDRDLGIAGSVVLSDGSQKLFRSSTPVARISQLAIHLDREVNERGLVLDKQLHLTPLWSTHANSSRFIDWVASQSKTTSNQIVHIDAQLFDNNPASILGTDQSLLASSRLDNQASCWAAIMALLDSSVADATQVVALFDHEEVGSESSTGAAGPMLEHCLERVAGLMDISRLEFLETLARSSCISADNAHAVHHNYPDRHDLANAPLINNGPALKLNSNQRYASSGRSAAIFVEACDRAKVVHQVFVSRNNMPCGTTIGPITATRLGIDTVDVGIPQLSMHSVREVCGVDDLISMRRLLAAYFN